VAPGRNQKREGHIEASHGKEKGQGLGAFDLGGGGLVWSVSNLLPLRHTHFVKFSTRVPHTPI
jgi:hypothetical protein